MASKPHPDMIKPPLRLTAEGTRSRFPCSSYTPQAGKRVCMELMKGKSLRKLCQDPRNPSYGSVVKWLADPRLAEFRENYYYARRVQAELRIDEIMEIADSTDKDWEYIYNKNGELIDIKPNNEAIQRSRVRIDTRKWYAGKMVPKIYGDTLNHELDVTGDLAELLKAASNKDSGLPPPIEGEIDDD